ncbi:MAG: hypothetical protein ABI939_11390 [Anaerolineaceae bacterium]
MKGLRGYQSETAYWLVRGMHREPGSTFTVMFPRQAGKNEVSASIIAMLLKSAAKSGGSVVVCAPTLHPQAAISLERTRQLVELTARLLPGSHSHYGLHESTLRLGAASAVFLSGSPAAHVAGHTASLAIIADEAQELDADWFNRQFRPMAASTNASTVLFGTPWDGGTLLEEAVRRNRAKDAKRHKDDKVRLHHEVSWQDVEAVLPAYGLYVRSERERLGANHPLFLSQYELIAAEDAGRLLTADQLANLIGAHPPLSGPRARERYVAGLDFGGDGEDADATVLTIARVRSERCEVVAHAAWRSAAYLRMQSGVIEAARARRLERICADATGMGGPIIAHLEGELGARLVERVVFGAASKSDLGYSLLAAANIGRLALHNSVGDAHLSRCLAELRECRSGYRLNRQLWWEAPSGGQDDYVASLALCLRASDGLGAERVARGRPRAMARD